MAGAVTYLTLAVLALAAWLLVWALATRRGP